MRLTAFTDFSLRLLIYLAAAPEQKATIGEVAAAYRISEHHMVKIVHLLGKLGLLKNTRGRGGGVALARPAREINLGQVVRLTEGGDLPAECFDPQTNSCRIGGGCRLRGLLRDAVDGFYRVLAQYTLEDIAISQPKLIRLLR